MGDDVCFLHHLPKIRGYKSMKKRLNGLQTAYSEAIKYGEYIILNQTTIREVARVYGVNHSKVHRYIKKLLPIASPEISTEVEAILEGNLADRHIRGGESNRVRCEGLK
jgi:hypothetical protein